jgi:hypothetical protein
MSDPVLIPATVELLDGWAGRVQGRVEGTSPASLVPLVHFGTRDQAKAWSEAGVSIFLDLRLPEARDRVLRVLAGRVGLDAYSCPLFEVIDGPSRVLVKLTDAYGSSQTWGPEAIPGLRELGHRGGPAEIWAEALRLLWLKVSPLAELTDG